MSDAHLFLSYSRKQFYFAESVVLSLQEAGVGMWFDAQDLAPGEQWRGEIERGLAEARGLVLIASEAAIASKYVRAEWEPILNAGKPVYVVLFEPCILPRELLDGATAIVDLRGRFKAGIKRLLEAINGEAAHKLKRVPRPNRLSVPIRLTGTVGIIAGSQAVMTLVLVVMVILALNDLLAAPTWTATAFAVLLLMWAYYIGGTTLDLLRRTYTFRQVLVALVLTIPVALFVMGVLYNVAPVAAFLTPFAPIVAVAVHFGSAGTYRWLPTGEAPAWMRRRYGLAAAPSLREMSQTLDATSLPQSQRYTVTHAPEDTAIADEIETVLLAAGHRHIPHDDNNLQPGDQHILLLSSHTLVADVEHMLARHAEALTPIVLDNVNARAAVDAIGQFQFVDYREHQQDQLEAIGMLFRHLDAAKMIYGTQVTPLSSRVLRHPQRVRTLANLTYAFFIVYMLVSVFFVSVGAGFSYERDLFGITAGLALAFWAALVAVMHVRVAGGVRGRSLTLRGLRVRLLLLGLVGLLLPLHLMMMAASGPLRDWLPSRIEQKAGPTLPRTDPNFMRNRAVRDSIIWGGLWLLILLESILPSVPPPS